MQNQRTANGGPPAGTLRGVRGSAMWNIVDIVAVGEGYDVRMLFDDILSEA